MVKDKKTIANIATRLGISKEFIGANDSHYKSDKNMTADDRDIYKRFFEKAYTWQDKVFSRETKKSLFMFGPNGSGKTSMGVVLLTRAFERKAKVLRVTMVALQEEYYKNWSIPTRALMPGFLLIDEVGKERVNKGEHTEAAFEYIIKYRSEMLLPTILISNADVDYLAKRYGATVERILKDRYIPFSFPEHNFRASESEKECEDWIND